MAQDSLEDSLKERTSSAEKFQQPQEFVYSRKPSAVWILRPYQNPHLCRYSSCLILKRVICMGTSLQLDQKTLFSKKSFNGGVNTALIHQSVLITQPHQATTANWKPLAELRGNSAPIASPGRSTSIKFDK